MSEECGDCGCFISDEEIETVTAEITGTMPFQDVVRSYVMSHLDVEDEGDVFISKVEICPETVEVEYSEGF